MEILFKSGVFTFFVLLSLVAFGAETGVSVYLAFVFGVLTFAIVSRINNLEDRIKRLEEEEVE